MSRINPLYIVAIITSLLLISLYILNQNINIFKQKQNEYKQIQIKAKEYKDFNTSWNNKKNISKTLDNILKNRLFLKEKILRVNTLNSIKIKIQSKNQKVLNTFLNKILNKKFIIKKLNLTKNYISLEIGTR